jgi:CubicO group peptidase (beta-lactamase class C family)
MTRVLILPLLLTLASPLRAETPSVAAALESIDRAVAADMAAHAVPGLEIAIVQDRALLWSHVYGVADLATGVTVTESTRFGIGSISKLFTALAIIQLRDAGRLNLDDAVTKSLPWFRLAGEPHPTVTLRDLLVQFGGLPREPIGASWQDRVMPDRDSLIRSMPDELPALAPETEWKYSNLGYAVLGLSVEAVSGQRYGDYIEAHIAQPLGMHHTGVNPPASGEAVAAGYSALSGGTRERRPLLDMGGVAPAAGVTSTAADLARFLLWMLDDRDGPVLLAQSRREMERVQAMTEDWSVGQGLGFEIRRPAGGGFRIGHAGRAAGYAARLEIDPATRLGIVVLTNADDATPTRLIDQVMGVLAPAVTAATAPPQPVPDPAWQAYVGTYISDDHHSSAIAIMGGRLAWLDPAEPVKSRIYLDPAGPGRFRFASGALVGEIVSFSRDDTGRVIAMTAAGTTDRRQ